MSEEIIVAEQPKTLASKAGNVYTGGKVAETRKEKIQVAAAMNASKSLFDEVDDAKSGNVTFECVNIISHDVELNNMDTGEVEDKNRIIFITKDGEAYSTSSESVFNQTATLIALFGHPCDWGDEPVKLKATLEKGKSGRKYLSVIPV